MLDNYYPNSSARVNEYTQHFYAESNTGISRSGYTHEVDKSRNRQDV